MTTKQLGNIGEAKTLSKFVELQIPVYLSFGDNEKADLIADFGGKLNKIQVKTSEEWKDHQKIIFDITSSTAHRKNGVKHIYTSDEIDYFSCYNLEADLLLLFPITEISSKTAITIRYPYIEVHNQFTQINWSDYTFEKIISRFNN